MIFEMIAAAYLIPIPIAMIAVAYSDYKDTVYQKDHEIFQYMKDNGSELLMKYLPCFIAWPIVVVIVALVLAVYVIFYLFFSGIGLLVEKLVNTRLKRSKTKKVSELPLGSKVTIDGYPFMIVEHKDGQSYLYGVGEGMTPEEWDDFYKRNNAKIKGGIHRCDISVPGEKEVEV